MISSLVSNIIDNIQIKIKNIYLRVEDELSFPGNPYALGIVIGKIEAQTMNGQWEPEFIANTEVTNKQFSIKDFAVYMNIDLEKPESVLFD
jgi:hypothetical protein